MNRIHPGTWQGEHRGLRLGGLHVNTDPERDRQRLRAWLDELGMLGCVQIDLTRGGVDARLATPLAQGWAPGCDTTGLATALSESVGRDARHLEREILAGLLLAPLQLEFPTFEELESSVRIRQDTVDVAATATLRFDVDQNRPEAFWRQLESGSFALREGCRLIEALAAAVRPEPGHELYGFGCYRASEYMMLLPIAREAARSHPELKQQLRERSTIRPIESREFHEVLLRELGTLEEPLPARWFVPGDRVWFRNPDGYSADAKGFEGSWVIYLGGGLFSNFWKRNAPFSLERKCIEIYHWRDATWRDPEGVLRVDEDEVERRVAVTESDPAERSRVLELMQRWRDPRGVYDQGGCLDRTRECARWIQPNTCDIAFAPA